MTDSGQRIGMLRFTVSDDDRAATLADGTIRPPAGIPGLDMRRLLPQPGPVDAPTGQEAPVTDRESPAER